MLIIRHGDIIFLLSPDLEKRLLFIQRKGDGLPMIRPFQHIHTYIYTITLILNLFDYILIRAHFDDHPDADFLVFGNLDKSACGAPSIFDLEGALAEEDLGVLARDAFLHNHDLVVGMSSDLPSRFIQFVVSGLCPFSRHNDNFVLHPLVQMFDIHAFTGLFERGNLLLVKRPDLFIILIHVILYWHALGHFVVQGRELFVVMHHTLFVHMLVHHRVHFGGFHIHLELLFQRRDDLIL